MIFHSTLHFKIILITYHPLLDMLPIYHLGYSQLLSALAHALTSPQYILEPTTPVTYLRDLSCFSRLTPFLMYSLPQYMDSHAIASTHCLVLNFISYLMLFLCSPSQRFSMSSFARLLRPSQNFTSSVGSFLESPRIGLTSLTFVPTFIVRIRDRTCNQDTFL